MSLEPLLREAPGSTAKYKNRMSRPKIQMFDEIGNGSIFVDTLPVLFGFRTDRRKHVPLCAIVPEITGKSRETVPTGNRSSSTAFRERQGESSVARLGAAMG